MCAVARPLRAAEVLLGMQLGGASPGLGTATATVVVVCGLAVQSQKCPFEAIMIINLPKDLEKETTHRYGPNSFKLHRWVGPPGRRQHTRPMAWMGPGRHACPARPFATPQQRPPTAHN